MTDRCPACDAMILGNEQYCRECAAPLLSNMPPTSPRLHWLVRTRSFVLVNCMLAILPTCMLIAPLTAMAGGPILIALGLALAFAGRRAAYPASIRLGLIQAGVAATWTVLVIALAANPRTQGIWMVWVFFAVVALFVASLAVWLDHPARDLRYQCDHCGYWIKGQITPRCPECGHPFDPARLAG